MTHRKNLVDADDRQGNHAAQHPVLGDYFLLDVMKNTIVRPSIELLWFSTVDEGKQLELNCQVEGVSYQLANIIADESDESLWFEICVDGKIVQIPIATVQRALEAAAEGVHSEAWYERNIPELQSPELSRAGRAYLKREPGNDT